MTPIPYHETGDGDGVKTLYVFLPGQEPVIVPDDHPKYDEIKTGAQAGNADPDEIQELADASIGVASYFEPITERISAANGRIYFDGDEVHSAIADQILIGIGENDEAWPFAEIAFLENVQQNPSANSREQLYDWLKAQQFTITTDGDIVGYKGVKAYTGDEAASWAYQSGSQGRAVVNGKVYEGHIPQGIGDTVEMPRSEVVENPHDSCSTGLHVGTFEYAQGFASPSENVLKVLVNPRDVVSVPTHTTGKKVRVCRYYVLEQCSKPTTEPVVNAATL